MDPEQSDTSEISAEPPQPQPEEKTDPAYTHRGNGFVARLPKAVRDQINFMLLDGVPYDDIPERIGDDAKHIKGEHVRRWKEHGHQRWLVEFQRREALQTAREDATDLLTQKAGVPVQDAGRTIAGAQLYELLQSFDPSAFAGALANKPELYLRLVNSLARLSEGEAVCTHRRAQDSLIEARLKNKESESGSDLISDEKLREIARLIKLL